MNTRLDLETSFKNLPPNNQLSIKDQESPSVSLCPKLFYTKTQPCMTLSSVSNNRMILFNILNLKILKNSGAPKSQPQ